MATIITHSKGVRQSRGRLVNEAKRARALRAASVRLALTPLSIRAASLAIVGAIALPQRASAIGAGDADAMLNAFNNAFLVSSGGANVAKPYYRYSLSDASDVGTWRSSLDIMVVEDAYERTGSVALKNQVNSLLTAWLQRTPPPWSWDGWNDDIGWFSLALVRGYQITGNSDFLNQAKYGFDYAYGRGWDTQYNGGGIWEENPEYCARYNPPKTPAKEPLSNDTLGMTACLIYQATHDASYLAKARGIYDWVWNHLYDYNSGLVYARIGRNGDLDRSANVYNQGLFADYANTIYEITGDANVYNDAKKAIDYVRSNETWSGGIVADGQPDRDTWADTLARGLGHYVRDNRQWGAYYGWMVQNANSILANRRTDDGLTGNQWDQPTSLDNTRRSTQYASAVAWLQFTPATQPNEIAGIHVITNQKTGLAIDNGGLFGNGKAVSQWGLSYGQNQKWLITPNSDGTYNIVSMSSWEALDCPGGSNQNNAQMVQWQTTRDDNQRWRIERQSDGSYRIYNLAGGLSLDGASATSNGAALVQYGWNGQSQQRWLLK